MINKIKLLPNFDINFNIGIGSLYFTIRLENAND